MMGAVSVTTSSRTWWHNNRAHLGGCLPCGLDAFGNAIFSRVLIFKKAILIRLRSGLQGRSNPGYLGGDALLIDQHQTFGLEVGLGHNTAFPKALYIGCSCPLACAVFLNAMALRTGKRSEERLDVFRPKSIT